MKNDDALLQQRLRNDDKIALGEVYTEYREQFLNFAVRYHLDKDVLMDIYQDSVVAMYQNFVEKQVNLTSSNIKTYLFGIGKNKIFNTLKAKGKMYPLPEETFQAEEVVLDTTEITAEQQLLAKHFNKISESCQEILKMYYYRGLTVKEMVSLSHYKDENTVKSHKSRCLKRLKELIISPN